MGDLPILYLGMFCFAMTLLGLVLTIYEFKKMGAANDKPVKAVDRSYDESEAIPVPSRERAPKQRAFIQSTSQMK